MSLFLEKILALFVYPLGGAIIIGTISFALTFTDRWRIGRALLGFMLAGLWLAATPAVADWLDWRLSSEVRSVRTEELPKADAVILLGGTPISRIMRAFEVYRAGKAPFIVITGGNLPWQRADVPEAQRVADFLVEIGAPRSALVLETRSRNTRENAINTTAIFQQHGWRHGLLVTEGIRMPRALATFQKVGLDVTPAARHISSKSLKVDSLLDLLPDVESLAWTTSAVKELVGFCVYRLRGWS